MSADAPILDAKDIARFWEHTEKQEGCWDWTGNALPNGYGVVRVRSLGRSTGAHRVSFFIANGYWPRVAMHTCDNRRCVNPAHILNGTYADNSADMVAKGRSRTGERNPSARLTWEDVRAIRRDFADGMKQARLADRHGLSRAGIHKIVHNRTWKEAA